MAKLPNRPTSGTDDAEPREICCGSNVTGKEWHDELVELFSAAPAFIDLAGRLVHAACEANDHDREITRIAGSHSWADQDAVYQLASALEAMAEAMAPAKS